MCLLCELEIALFHGTRDPGTVDLSWSDITRSDGQNLG